MGSAVADLTSFDEVYVETDWSRHAELPAVEAANRINAYDNFLRMQQEALGKERDRAPVTLNDYRSPHTAHRSPLTAHRSLITDQFRSITRLATATQSLMCCSPRYLSAANDSVAATACPAIGT